jgi:hypothetical protein
MFGQSPYRQNRRRIRCPTCHPRQQLWIVDVWSAVYRGFSGSAIQKMMYKLKWVVMMGLVHWVHDHAWDAQQDTSA